MVFKYPVEHQQFIILLLPALGLHLSLSPSIFEQDYTGSFSITGLDDSNVLKWHVLLNLYLVLMPLTVVAITKTSCSSPILGMSGWLVLYI